LHFTPQCIDGIISKFRRDPTIYREQFQDTFYALNLTHKNLWLKQRKNLLTGDCRYSLKKLTLHEDEYKTDIEDEEGSYTEDGY
jgi:hypothetical protein